MPSNDQSVTSYAHAIITGGSSGIGRSLALQLARRGTNVTIIARGQERLDRARQDIVAASIRADQQVLALSADVSDRLQAEWGIQEAIARLGPPSVLITSAGMAYPNYFQDIPIDIFEQTMAINYFGTLYCIRAALPAMETLGRGDIVMISSGAGLIGLYGYSAYCPSKFALRGLAESLRGELKPLGIGVAIAYPPDTDTPQLVEENKTKPPATKEITATAKLWQPDDVAQVILTAVDKGKFEITPGFEMTVLNRLHSLIAPLLNRQFDQIAARHPRL
ncbi:SDR family oxidoreductase [Okeania sp. SIO2G5]|uniref:SDR family oxidoreductase n=1 Tax=Okeania sp. SIO2G5 TaxID=2607796 RepID=UPI0013C05A92|nr:SDR family oxidoreductase [Okeania sp. SIO2G5]NEP76239.1 SDR family oxidoreductase [Okeania sp. SIO2G5]